MPNKKKMVRMNILILPEDMEKLQKLCDKFDTDISKFMRKLIKKVVN
ncbi:hypothetical protein LCGC14_0838340 [marine sediment metagenome]|uniref:Uncharacterized protein n=1 Tax=marine sediment metagenome TaxID=412755 RepID=A0A0F9PZ55_9ZZZZ